MDTSHPLTTARSCLPSGRLAEGLDAQGCFAHPGSADSTRTPTDSSASICPRAPITALSHLRRSAASWTHSTTGHGNVLASRLQISSSQESTHLLHLRVESALINIDGLVKSQRHQLLEEIGCSEHRVLKGARVSNGLMTPKSDCILHPVDFLRVHQYYIKNIYYPICPIHTIRRNFY
jgi:hypothetical protein